MSSVLVAGGAGYIGSHTVKALVQAGRRVVVYDNLSSGHRQAVGGAPFVKGDVSDVAALRQTMRQYEVEAVMQFAAFLIVSDSVRDPIGYYRNNVQGTLGVLEAMALESVRRFVFSSTCAVYGEPARVPITEDQPTAPINSYGETKLAIERALPHFEGAYGLKSVRLRYFNAAGADPAGELGEEHDPEIHLIPRAIDAVRGGAELAIFGDDYDTPDGTCLRDYIHVTDLADAHVRALERLDAAESSAVYNLGYGRPYSVREVIDTVSDVVGRRVPCRLAPRRPGDPAVLYASNSRVQRELGWRPRYDNLQTIVEHAWRWRETHPSGYPPDL